MAIAFVNGAVNGSSTGVQTIAVSYSPTSGNTVCVFLNCSATVTNLTCVDSNSASLQSGPALGISSTTEACFYYVAGTGVTGFTASWTGSAACNFAVVEYSGVLSVNPSLSGNTSTGSSATASITVTTQDANDYIVGSLSSPNIITMTVGTLRKSNSAGGGAPRLFVSDNTVASAGSLSLTGTLTSAAWGVLVLELRTVAAAASSGSNWLSKALATGVNRH